ncbi:Carbon-nitrogen hydrolase [Moorella glycerini]|uniref:Formamidase n=2 Tax=Neomoorella stamsii TaxID=1266720 RepID=A0A9X7J1K5_9FIRM|nr:nitrilase-related carbon-nitrogen hydrolase [Moorella glycerini]PRR71510.1 Formamidase [Moorella stamsii]CEP68721.1 Carbon-nitrogen hydrolase [Moorella glycerini]
MTCINPVDGAMAVVMVQFAPVAATSIDEVEQNIDTIRNYVKRAVNSFPGVDMVVFPEYSTTGFAYYSYHYLMATTVPGPVTDKLAKIASDHGIWLVSSIVEKNEDPELMPYNGMLIFDPNGNIALKYRKMNPWNPKEPWTPGEEMPVCDGPKGTKLAVMLCYDGDLPEPAREAAWKGATVLIRPSKYMYPWNRVWEITNRARAYENIAYVVAVNTVGEDESYSYFGRSMVVDFEGNIINEMDGTAGMIKVDIYPQLVANARKQRASNNHLYNLKHRGYTGVPPYGVRTNPYSVYREWEKIPPEFSDAPPLMEPVANIARTILGNQKERLKKGTCR